MEQIYSEPLRIANGMPHLIWMDCELLRITMAWMALAVTSQ